MDDPLQILAERDRRDQRFVAPFAAADDRVVVAEENADRIGFAVEHVSAKTAQRLRSLVAAETGIDDLNAAELQFFLEIFDITVGGRGEAVAEAQQGLTGMEPRSFFFRNAHSEKSF